MLKVRAVSVFNVRKNAYKKSQGHSQLLAAIINFMQFSWKIDNKNLILQKAALFNMQN